jgi:vacuolar-type H+-ATPase subunit H
VEAALAGKLAAADEEARAALARATAEAQTLIACAEAEGRQLGLGERETAVREAQAEADCIRAAACVQAETLRTISPAAKAAAVARAVAIVIGGVT